MRRYDITQIAEQILNQYWDRNLPINVEHIAKQMGAIVEYKYVYGAVPAPDGSFADDDAYYDISGRFDMVNGRPFFTIRQTDSETRQRFTLAHELGHYVLRHGNSFRDNQAALSQNYDPKETEANMFAAELLMPEFIVNHLISDEKIQNISNLAHRFHVSYTAMEYRLRNLNWI